MNTKDIFPTILAITALFLILTGFLVLFILLFQHRRKKHKLEIIDMESRFETELLQTQLEIQENTLRNISQEIHDNIGQILSLAKLQLYNLPINFTHADLQPTKELIAKSINDLRNLSKSLNPDRIVEIGFTESIQHELQLLQNTNAIETFFEVRGQTIPIPPERMIIIFRIFQEIMNNTIRHSEAKMFSVVIEYKSKVAEMTLTLTDDGKGFDTNIKKGIGLTSMQNRAGMINAVLLIDSKPDTGTSAVLTVNLLENA